MSPHIRPKYCVNQPFFLVGAERSGSTLLRLMLDHHPALAFQYEFEFAVDKMVSGEFPDLKAYAKFLETDRIFQSCNFEVDLSLSYPELMDSFLQQRREKSGKPLVGATVHRYFDQLLAIWPDARFIHLVRDPRDVSRSCIGMNWAGNVWTGVERWIEVENLWEEMWHTIPSHAQIELHFENLVAEPVANLKLLCDFIGIDYDPAMLSYVESTTYDLPDIRMANQWRHKMKSRDIQLVENRVGDLLEARGYSASGIPEISVGPLLNRQMQLQSNWIVKVRRVGIYGLPLVISSWLSRKLKMENWQKKVLLKCNQIDSVFLK